MEFRELRSLVSLSELGSISLTAEQLHLSPAAIHKQLKALEKELGVRLYEKVGPRLQITPLGEALLPYLKDLLAEYDSALSAIEEWKGLKKGVVRIGSGPTSYVLPAILKKFRRENPRIELLVETGNTPVLLEGLSRGSLDLALLVSTGPPEPPEFCTEAHWNFEFVLVSHLRENYRRPHLSDLKDLRFILYRTGSRMQQFVDRYFAAHGFEPQVTMRFDNAEFIRVMVCTGLGVAFLPLWIVNKDVKEGRLHIIHQAEPPLSAKIVLVRRRLGHVPRPVQAFIEAARNLDPRSVRLLTMAGPGSRLTSNPS